MLQIHLAMFAGHNESEQLYLGVNVDESIFTAHRRGAEATQPTGRFSPEAYPMW